MKRVLFGVAVIAVATAVVVIWGFFSVLHTLGVEDRIHHAFFPMAVAIERFAETNGVPPKTLDDLVPSFLDHIPVSPLVDKVEYTIVGSSNWVLNVHSTALEPARVYSWRSDWTFTDEERAKLMKQFHSVSVFKE